MSLNSRIRFLLFLAVCACGIVALWDFVVYPLIRECPPGFIMMTVYQPGHASYESCQRDPPVSLCSPEHLALDPSSEPVCASLARFETVQLEWARKAQEWARMAPADRCGIMCQAAQDAWFCGDKTPEIVAACFKVADECRRENSPECPCDVDARCRSLVLDDQRRDLDSQETRVPSATIAESN